MLLKITLTIAWKQLLKLPKSKIHLEVIVINLKFSIKPEEIMSA